MALSVLVAAFPGICVSKSGGRTFAWLSPSLKPGDTSCGYATAFIHIKRCLKPYLVTHAVTSPIQEDKHDDQNDEKEARYDKEREEAVLAVVVDCIRMWTAILHALAVELARQTHAARVTVWRARGIWTRPVICRHMHQIRSQSKYVHYRQRDPPYESKRLKTRPIPLHQYQPSAIAVVSIENQNFDERPNHKGADFSRGTV